MLIINAPINSHAISCTHHLLSHKLDCLKKTPSDQWTKKKESQDEDQVAPFWTLGTILVFLHGDEKEYQKVGLKINLENRDRK